jgi:hypothetical protein
MCVCCQHIQQESEKHYWNSKQLQKMMQLLQEDTNFTAWSATANTQGRNTSYESSALNRRILQATGEKSTVPDGNTTKSQMHNNHNQY